MEKEKVKSKRKMLKRRRVWLINPRTRVHSEKAYQRSAQRKKERETKDEFEAI